MNLSVPCSASSSLLGCYSGGVLVRPVEGLFFRMVGVVAGCCGFRFRVTGIEPRRQFLRRLSSIYFGNKVADGRSQASYVLWMESWGTDSCGFTKFGSLSSSRWVDVLVSLAAAAAAGRRRARTRLQGLGCGCNFLFFESPYCKRGDVLDVLCFNITLPRFAKKQCCEKNNHTKFQLQ